MAKPSADGVDASHAGPARGDDASEAGPSAGNSVPHGVVDPSAASSSTAVAVAAADHPHVNRLREQDHFMPVANVIRIMRRVLPMHAKISDGAKEMMQECLSEYISFITGEANERCKQEQRKTITAEDVIWAMERLGFDNYVGPLRLYIQRYRQAEGDQRIGLSGEHFPIIRHRRHTAIRDTDRAPPLHAQSLLMRQPQPPAPAPSSPIMPATTVVALRGDHLFDEAPGADYFLRMYGGGDGSRTSSSEAPPMPDFFP